jgi:acetyl-CoA/propionyl-CoA carboxylase biotin carboxyl carrier protein
LTADERRDLHDGGRVGTAAGLRNAATAEFLRSRTAPPASPRGEHPAQVEHGVTEAGLRPRHRQEQFWLAAGHPLSDDALAAAIAAADPTGHAIEVRIAAEDPARDFTPTPGRVTRWVMPAGPGVRIDTGIEAGDRIPAEYDNLIAKILVHAGDREAAVARLRRALDETEIGGIQTSLPFHRFVSRSAAFAAAELSTGWVGEWWDGPAAFARAARLAMEAAGLEAAETGLDAFAVTVPAPAASSDDGAWRRAARAAAIDRWP